MTKEEVEKFVDDMMQQTSKRIMVDPPSGWHYGFPKPYYKSSIGDSEELNAWLVSEGYPEEEIKRYGPRFPVRYWMEID
jgi:hypothetical protein